MPKPTREMWMKQLNAHLLSYPSFMTQSKIKKGHSNTYNWVVHVLRIAKLQCENE